MHTANAHKQEGPYVAKVDDGLGVREAHLELLPPALVRLPERPAHLPQRLLALRGRVGGDEVRQPLHLRQVHAPVPKRPLYGEWVER